jgi:hypothetical protein
VPTGAATLTPRSWLAFSFWPVKNRLSAIPHANTQKRSTFAIYITEHGRSDIDGEDIIAARSRVRIQEMRRAAENLRIGEEANTSDETDLDVERTASITDQLVVSNQSETPMVGRGRQERLEGQEVGRTLSKKSDIREFSIVNRQQCSSTALIEHVDRGGVRLGCHFLRGGHR